MAGGEAGMRHFLAQFGPALKLPWTKLEAPELTEELIDLVSTQSDDQAEGVSIRDLEIRRDDCLIAVLSPCAPMILQREPSSRIMSGAAEIDRPDSRRPSISKSRLTEPLGLPASCFAAHRL